MLAEYIALTYSIKELLWIENICQEIGLEAAIVLFTVIIKEQFRLLSHETV